MKRSFSSLACAAAMGVLAASAQAQYGAPSSPSAPSRATAAESPPPADASSRMAPASMTTATDPPALSEPDSAGAAKSKADADLRAAQTACNAKTLTDRDECLRIAQEKYIRALDESGNSSLQDPPSGTYSNSPNSSETGPGIPSATSVPSGTASDGDVTGK